MSVSCKLDYFTTGTEALELGWNFFGDFELIANNDENVETVTLKAFEKTSTGAEIRITGAVALLSASLASICSALLF